MMHSDRTDRPGAHGPRLWAVRVLGIALLSLALLPIYRLLDRPETGRFGSGAVIQADANLATAWWGSVVVLVLGAVLAFLIAGDRLRPSLQRWGRALLEPAAGAEWKIYKQRGKSGAIRTGHYVRLSLRLY